MTFEIPVGHYIKAVGRINRNLQTGLNRAFQYNGRPCGTFDEQRYKIIILIIVHLAAVLFNSLPNGEIRCHVGHVKTQIHYMGLLFCIYCNSQ